MALLSLVRLLVAVLFRLRHCSHHRLLVRMCTGLLLRLRQLRLLGALAFAQIGSRPLHRRRRQLRLELRARLHRLWFDGFLCRVRALLLYGAFVCLARARFPVSVSLCLPLLVIWSCCGASGQGTVFSGQLGWLLAFVEAHKYVLVGLICLVAGISSWRMHTQRTRA